MSFGVYALEEWRNVLGYEGFYQVSNWGRVKSLARIVKNDRGQWLAKESILKGSDNGNGYRRFMLSLGGKAMGKKKFLHIILMESFAGSRPDGMDVCHWDGNPSNNFLPNLRYDTRSGNQIDMLRCKTSKNQYGHAKAVKRSDGEVFSSTGEAERSTGVSAKNISAVCNGRRKSAGGFVWNYIGLLLILLLSNVSFGAVGVTLPNHHNITQEADSSFGPNTLTIDPVNGLGFLDMQIFQGLSFHQMNLELQSNPLLSGFRRATKNEVVSLVNSGGFWPVLQESTWYGSQNHISHAMKPLDELVNSLGPTYQNDPQQLIRGFVDDFDSVTGKPYRIFISDVADGQPELYDHFPPDWLDNYTDPEGNVLDFVERFADLLPDTASGQTGHFLVTPTTPELNSAITWGVLLIVGMACFSRRLFRHAA